MFARLALAVVTLALAVAGCDRRPPPPARRGHEDSHCRAECFLFARLTCAAVETECGKNRGILVIEGLPHDCTDVEPVACRLEQGMETCLSRCEDPGISAPRLDERPAVSY